MGADIFPVSAAAFFSCMEKTAEHSAHIRTTVEQAGHREKTNSPSPHTEHRSDFRCQDGGSTFILSANDKIQTLRPPGSGTTERGKPESSAMFRYAAPLLSPSPIFSFNAERSRA